MAFLVLFVFACDDEYGACKKKNGCNGSRDSGASASWSGAEPKVEGVITFRGVSYRTDGRLVPRRDGLEVFADPSSSPPTEEDAGVADASAADAEGGADADGDADATSKPAYDGATSDGYSRTYDTSRQLRLRFVPPDEPGTYRLEDVRAVAITCPTGSGLQLDYNETCIDARGALSNATTSPIEGRLEWLDVRTDDVSAPGAPTSPPYEMPWGWVIRTSDGDPSVDVRVTSKPTWYASPSYDFCD